MDYNTLKNKTVFDFCDDTAILAKVTGFPEPLKSKEYIIGLSPIVHSQMLQALADETNNYGLREAATKLETELWENFDKNIDASRGLIIEP